jgi:hypothetical protein
MPTFDVTKLPYSLDPILVQVANRSVEALRTREVSEIPLAEPPHGFRLSNKVRTFIQANIRRCLTFIEGGLAEYNAGRPLIADQCSRSIYENVAAFHDFCEKLKPILATTDYKKIDDMIMRTAFATRVVQWLDVHGQEYQAINIITQINKLARIKPVYGEAFERLCDIVHPNGLGTVVYFSTVDQASGMARLTDIGNDPDRAYASLVLAASLLLRFENDISELEPMLKTLTASYNP